MQRPHASRLRTFAPGLGGARWGTLRFDLFAGLTVAAVAIPQALAYAWVAGLPAEMGLMAAALPCRCMPILNAMFVFTGSTSPHGITLQ